METVGPATGPSLGRWRSPPGAVSAGEPTGGSSRPHHLSLFRPIYAAMRINQWSLGRPRGQEAAGPSGSVDVSSWLTWRVSRTDSTGLWGDPVIVRAANSGPRI